MHKTLRSFRHAFRGIGLVVRSQRNAWIHSVATIVVGAAGFVFELNRLQWCLIAVAIGLVWMAETLNTSIERLADAVTLEENTAIRDAKDLAAAGVLLAAMTALAIGVFVMLDIALNQH